VLSFFSANGTGYVVMEYLAGQTLYRYATNAGRVEPQEALRILIPVADALRTCHDASLIHRDISPDNILVTRDGLVKLLDFGAARFALGSRSTNMSVILKEGFAPFEQYQRNGTQGPWTDVYAFAATLYRLIGGALPPSAPDRVGGEKVPTLAEQQVVASDALQALIDRGMAIAPADRYQTIDALLDDLLALPELGDEAVARPRVAAPFAPRISRFPNLVPQKYQRPAFAAAAIASLGLLGSLTYAAVRLSPAPSQPDASPATHYAGGTISSLRETVRQGAQSRLQFELAQTQIDDALESIKALKKISTNTTLIQAQDGIRDSAISDRDHAISKYRERVEWLAGHNPSIVDAAFRLELESMNAPEVDSQDLYMKDAICKSINAMISDIATQRNGTLSSESIIYGASRKQ
jgi:serine/threonine protein kinase